MVEEGEVATSPKIAWSSFRGPSLDTRCAGRIVAAAHRRSTFTWWRLRLGAATLVTIPSTWDGAAICSGTCDAPTRMFFIPTGVLRATTFRSPSNARRQAQSREMEQSECTIFSHFAMEALGLTKRADGRHLPDEALRWVHRIGFGSAFQGLVTIEYDHRYTRLPSRRGGREDVLADRFSTATMSLPSSGARLRVGEVYYGRGGY